MTMGIRIAMEIAKRAMPLFHRKFNKSVMNKLKIEKNTIYKLTG